MREFPQKGLDKEILNEITRIKTSTESEKLIPIISDLTIETTGEVTYR